MAIKALNLGSIDRFVPDDDPDKGTPDETAFLVGVLDSNIMGYIQDRLTSYQNNAEGGMAKISVHEAAVLAARFALRGWENFANDDGEIEFTTKELSVGGKKYTVVDVEAVAHVPLGILMRIYRKVREENNVTPVQAKNSDAG